METITKPSDYLIGETKIPNAISGNAGEGLNGDLDYIIKKYEKALLLNLLGYDQWRDLQTALEDLPNADQKWQDLVNGKEEWKGLAPIVKNFVYCHWIRFHEIKVSTTGAGKAKVKNYSISDYNQKYTDRWNELARWTDCDFRDFVSETEGLELNPLFVPYGITNQFGI